MRLFCIIYSLFLQQYSPIFENPIKNLTDSDLLRQIKDLSSINTQNNSPLITNEHKSAFFHYESSRNVKQINFFSIYFISKSRKKVADRMCFNFRIKKT